MIRAILCALAAFSTIMFAGWYCGYDLLERGPNQANTFICAIWAAFGVGIMASVFKPKGGAQ